VRGERGQAYFRGGPVYFSPHHIKKDKISSDYTFSNVRDRQVGLRV
jgi:hypothetical protein